MDGDFATSAVTKEYVHRDKIATPRETITVGNSRLKWSNIGYADAPVPAEILDQALKRYWRPGETSGVMIWPRPASPEP